MRYIQPDFYSLTSFKGSCWSFSTTGSTEGCHKIKTGTLVSLSEQNLMDCSTSYGNQGCDGGLMTQAMEYIINNNGIDTETSYPYTAQDGTCHYSVANRGATLSSYNNVPSGNEDALQQSVSQGPTSVAIDASQSSFQLYTSGVYYDPNCSSQSLDHGVLAVGWGVDGSQDYWIVKNSWGTDWGLQGYIWMSRNRNNNCGIATMATLPLC
jgi:cathepsin L